MSTYAIGDIHGCYDQLQNLLEVIQYSHAGISVNWALRQALGNALEVEQMLSEGDPKTYLKHVYADKPEVWPAQLSAPVRFRIMINYFTWLRFCAHGGTINPTHKTQFAHPDSSCRGRKIAKFYLAIGQGSMLNGETGCPQMIALDTGCVWGKSLTAYRLDAGQFFSVRAKQT